SLQPCYGWRMHGGFRVAAFALLMALACERSHERKKTPPRGAPEAGTAPIPCAMVQEGSARESVTRFESRDGHIVAIETEATLRDRFTLHYGSDGQLRRVDKLTTALDGAAGKSIEGTTEFEYQSDGRIGGFVYTDDAGRRLSGRYTYAEAERRPTQLELFVDDERIERVRFDYDGPRWREPLFLGGMGLYFGYTSSFSDTGEGERPFKTARLDPNSGALL